MLRNLVIILLALLVGYCIGLFGWAFLAMYGWKALFGTCLVLILGSLLLSALTKETTP